MIECQQHNTIPITSPRLLKLVLNTYTCAAWEIWRLRLNFFVVMVLSFLGGIGYTSTLSTFHQYVTNPREEDLNGTDLQGVVSACIRDTLLYNSNSGNKCELDTA